MNILDAGVLNGEDSKLWYPAPWCLALLLRGGLGFNLILGILILVCSFGFLFLFFE